MLLDEAEMANRISDEALDASVTRLAWATHEAEAAPDAPPLLIARLALVPEEEHGALRFTLHPSVRLVDAILVHRVKGRVVARSLDAGTLALVAAFASGATLECARAAAVAATPDFDVPASLVALADGGVLTDVHTDLDHPSFTAG